MAVEETRYYKALLHTEKLAAVGTAVASLSHDIKNIMHGVRFGGDLVRRGLAGNDAELLKTGWRLVERNQIRIDDLIQDMLNYSKDREPACESTDLAKLVSEVVDEIRQRLGESNVSLTFEPCEMPECDVRSCRAASGHSQCHHECGSMRSKDSPDPGIVLTFDRPDDRAVELIVSDTGPGVPAEMKEEIFKPFVSSKGNRGTGLGLPVSRKILREHGGDLTAEEWPRGKICVSNSTALAVRNESRCPRQAAAKGNEQDRIPGGNPFFADGFVPRERNGGRRGIAEPIEIDHHAVGRNARRFEGRIDDPRIDLVRDDEAEFRAQFLAIGLGLFDQFNQPINGKLEHFAAVHPQILQMWQRADSRRRVGRDHARHLNQFLPRSVREELNFADADVRILGWREDHRPGRIAEENAGIAVGIIRDASQCFRANHEDVFCRPGSYELLTDTQGVDEAGTGGRNVERGNGPAAKIGLNQIGRRRAHHVRRDRGTDDQIDVLRRDSRNGQGFPGRFRSHRGRRIGRADDPPFANAGPRANPFVGRIERRREFIVRHDAVGHATARPANGNTHRTAHDQTVPTGAQGKEGLVYAKPASGGRRVVSGVPFAIHEIQFGLCWRYEQFHIERYWR